MKKQYLILMGLIILLAAGMIFYDFAEKQRGIFKVVFLNVGQGDASFIQFENKKKLLVDCGPNRIILSALSRNMFFYDRNIDYLIITHPDLDHYGGCIDVLKHYKVKAVIHNGAEKNDSYYKEWKKALQESGAQEIIANDSLQIDNRISFLNYESNFSSDDFNNSSIVFKLNGNQSFLFTGDMEEKLEDALVAKYCTDTDCLNLKADVLKVGHHGAETSTSEKFLQAVNAKTAVISVGENKFGHPSKRVLKRIERAGADVLRTDQKGDVVFK